LYSNSGVLVLRLLACSLFAKVRTVLSYNDSGRSELVVVISYPRQLKLRGSKCLAQRTAICDSIRVAPELPKANDVLHALSDVPDCCLFLIIVEATRLLSNPRLIPSKHPLTIIYTTILTPES
jgi:hypothetical protein